MKYRFATSTDIPQLTDLAINTWSEFKSQLSTFYWNQLADSLNAESTYSELLEQSDCWVCENNHGKIIGMIFLVPKGNPTDIYKANWCYIRFLTVHPEYKGQGIGKQLTLICIEHAQKNNESLMALHTSEMMTHAIQLYTNLGFEMYKEIPKRLGKTYWLYTKSI